jgi:ribosome-associated translation inhibitor RaiA
MNVQFSFKSVPDKDKKFVQEYFYEKKEERLKKLISEEKYEASVLNIRSEKFAKKEAYKVEFILELPEHKFISYEDDHTIVEALDLALDKLIIQLRKYHEKNVNN